MNFSCAFSIRIYVIEQRKNMQIKLLTVSLLIVAIFMNAAHGVKNQEKKYEEIEDDLTGTNRQQLIQQSSVRIGQILMNRFEVMLKPSDVEMILAHAGTQLWSSDLCAVFSLKEFPITSIENQFLNKKKIKILPTYGEITNRIVTFKFLINMVDTSYPMLACRCVIQGNEDHIFKNLSKYTAGPINHANNIPSSNICIYEGDSTEGKIYISRGLALNSFFLYALYETDKVPHISDWDGNLIGRNEASSSSTSQIPEVDKFVVIAQLFYRKNPNFLT